MAIQASDTFSAVGSGTVVGRTLNNELGGSQSLTWNGTTVIGAGSAEVAFTADPGVLSVLGSGVSNARVRFRLGGVENVRIWANASASSGPHSTYAAFLVGGNSLRVRSFDNAGNTLGDVSSRTISAVSTGVEKYIGIAVASSQIQATIYESDGSTVYEQMVYSAGSANVSAGPWWGASNLGAGTLNLRLDNWIMEDAGAPPPPPAASNVYSYNPLGNLVVDLGGLRYY